MHIVFDTISHGYLSVGKDYHMNEHNQKHLTLSNRTYIEQELLQKTTFSSILNFLFFLTLNILILAGSVQKCQYIGQRFIAGSKGL